MAARTEIDVSSLTVRQLLALERADRNELNRRGVVRSRNPPAGDLAE